MGRQRVGPFEDLTDLIRECISNVFSQLLEIYRTCHSAEDGETYTDDNWNADESDLALEIEKCHGIIPSELNEFVSSIIQMFYKRFKVCIIKFSFIYTQLTS